MTAPIIPLEVIQVGLEGTRGTTTVATRILDFTPGGATLTRDLNEMRVRQAGSMATSHRSYPGRDHIAVDIAATCTFDWLPWWFNLFLGPLSTPTGGPGYVYAFVGSNTVVSDISDIVKTCSMEATGLDTWPATSGAFLLNGVMGDKLTIDIKQNLPWTQKASLVGKSITMGAKTAGKAVLASPVDILGTLTKVYLDTTSNAFGTTQKAGDVISATIEIDLGQSERFTLDSQRNPYRVGLTGPRKVSAKVVVEWDALTEYTAAQAGTAQRLRLVASGPTANYAANIDIAGTWDSLVLSQDGGAITEELTLTGQYDSTPASDIAASVTNVSAALP